MILFAVLAILVYIVVRILIFGLHFLAAAGEFLTDLLYKTVSTLLSPTGLSGIVGILILLLILF